MVLDRNVAKTAVLCGSSSAEHAVEEGAVFCGPLLHLLPHCQESISWVISGLIRGLRRYKVVFESHKLIPT